MLLALNGKCSATRKQKSGELEPDPVQRILWKKFNKIWVEKTIIALSWQEEWGAVSGR